MWVFQWADVSTDPVPLYMAWLGLLGYVVLTAQTGRTLWTKRQQAQRDLDSLALLRVASVGVLAALGMLLEMYDISLYGSLLGFNLKMSAAFVLGFRVFVYAGHYLGSAHRLKGRWTILLGTVTGVWVVLIWTNPWHNLVIVHPTLNCEQVACPLRRDDWGPFYAVGNGWSAFLMLYALAQLWIVGGQVASLYRPQVWALSTAFMLPVVIGVAVSFGAPELLGYDLGMWGIALAAWPVVWAVRWAHLLEATPAAWIQALTLRSDPTLHLRGDHRVVDANPQARVLLGYDPVGQALGQVAPQLSLHPRQALAWDATHFEVRTQRIGPVSAPLGYLVTLYDVTALTQARQDLEANVALLTQTQTQLEVQNHQLERSNLALAQQRDQLDAVNAELAEQNQQLGAAQRVLGEQNAQLESARQALERQNARLEDTQRALTGANAQLQHQATHDALTGLHNRRHLSAVLEGWVTHPEAGELSLVMLDVDLFREINARHGYLGGDQVLRGLGAHLCAQVPPGATACRYGGEEFCVLLPGMPPEDARRWAYELRRSIAAVPFEYRGQRIRVQVTVALTSQSTHGLDHLLSGADLALHQSKRAGREGTVRALPTWGRGLI